MSQTYVLRNVRTAITILAICAVLSAVVFLTVSITKAEGEEVSLETAVSTDASTDVSASANVVATEPAPVVDEAPAVVEEPAAIEEPTVTEEPLVVTEPEVPATEDVSGSPDAQAPPSDDTVSAPGPTPSPALSILPDQPEYFPGQTISIVGSWFQSLTNFVINIFGSNDDGSDYEAEPIYVTSDSVGSFSTPYTLDNIVHPIYTVVASFLNSDGSTGDEVTRTTFLDPLVSDFKQSANNETSGAVTGLGNIHWIGSIVQSSNSKYLEGMSNFQRTIFTSVPATTGDNHSLSFSHQFTKGGVHAYDFLTSYAQATADDAAALGTAISLNPCGIEIGPPGSLGTTCSTVRGGVNFVDVVVPDDSYISKDGSTAAKIAAYETTHGNRTIRIYGNAPISGAALSITHSVANLADTGDSDTKYILTWNSTATTILIEMAGHLAITGDGTGESWGPGLGSSQISGGPYHFNLDKLGGAVVSGAQTEVTSLGSQDNQIKGADIIQPGTIVVVKNATGGNNTFAYTATGNGMASPFNVTTSGGTGSQTFSNLTAGSVGGSRTITEGAAPSGWAFTSLSCVVTVVGDTTNTGASSVSTSGAVATVSNLASGSVVTCTYTNSLIPQNTISGVKFNDLDGDGIKDGSDTPLSGWTITLNPGALTDVTDGSGVYSFANLADGTYTLCETPQAGWVQTYPNPGTFACSNGTNGHTVVVSGGATVSNIDFGNTNKGKIIVNKVTVGGDDSFTFNTTGSGYNGFSLSNGQSNSQDVVAGAYTVSEAALAGWSSDNGVCDQGETPGSVDVGAGETVTCTFTNTKLGKIIVDKITDPTGSTQSFEFDPSWSISNFNLTDAATPNDSGYLAPGNYSVAENAVSGWDLTSATCDDGSNPASIGLSAGEVVTCTFTNTQRGHIIVDKVTVGGDATFSFDANGGTSPTYNDFTLTGVQTPNNQELKPGSYSVSEGALVGWDQTSAVCDGNNNTPASITLGAGQTVTCTFTNTKHGKIIIEKQTLPDGSLASFGFTGEIVTSLVDDGTADKEVSAGTYTVTETPLAGWDLTGLTCDDNNSSGNGNVATFNVEPGETVKCTFTNTQRGKIIINKVTVGGDSQFEFDSNYDANFFLGNGGSNDSGLLVPGTYNVDEVNIPAGWAKTSAVCDDGSPISAIALGAGETVTCTFTNNKPAAQIDVDPLSAYNKVGDDHVITATVQVHNGNGSYVPAADGTLVTFSITNSNGATAVFVPAIGGDTCTTTAGSCSVTINSPTTGTVSVHASSDPVELAVTILVETDGTGDNSANAGKTYVNAKISITPDASTNEVGDDHTFVVTVMQDAGDGLGFVPVPAGTLANAKVLPTTTLNASDCTDGVDGSGQCNVIVNSSVAGVFTIKARSTVTVGTVTFKLETNGSGGNSVPAVKTYVDANISLDPLDATNNVNAPHTVTVTVMKNPGIGSVVAAGEHVDFTLTPAGATPVVDAGLSTCDEVGANTDGSGQCIIVFTSATPGTVDISATVTLDVGGVSLTRATDGTNGSTGHANKTYVAGKIIVVKQTLPDLSTQSFEFDPSWSATNFNLTDGQSNDSGYLALGNYSVSEGAVAGWDSDGGVCDGNGNTPASITLNNGDVVTCTFTNTQRGHLIVQKTTLPGGDTTSFVINASGTYVPVNGAAGSVTDANDYDYEVKPGTYSVAETIPAGWDKTGDTCQNVVVAPGETKTCLLTNTKRGSITIVKDADPNDSQDFVFGGTLGAFTLDDDAGVVEAPNPDLWQNSQTFTNQIPGDYTVTEIIPTDWIQKSVSCVNTVGGAAYAVTPTTNGVIIPLVPGADVTCTFVNTNLAPTRTLGFWQTHTQYTSGIFATNLLSSMPIGTTPHKGFITTAGQLFGAFYSSISKKTAGGNRLAVDKARMVLLQQLVAAKLNCAAFGCAGSVSTMIAAADAAYAGTSIAAMTASTAALDFYNNSGDTIIIGFVGSATPKVSQSTADKVFWDLP